MVVIRIFLGIIDGRDLLTYQNFSCNNWNGILAVTKNSIYWIESSLPRDEYDHSSFYFQNGNTCM